MARRLRTQERIAGEREAMALAATLGGTVKAARIARRWTLDTVARKVGISVARLSEIERGLGSRAPLETWIAIGIAVDRPLAVAFSKPIGVGGQLADAGHLQIQEHVLRLAQATGRHGTFELPTRPLDPSRSTDVGIRDASRHTRVLAECWNTFGDLGAAVRSTRRKEQEAAATWPDDRIASVWIVRDSAANRALLGRYPNIIDAAFPGSSRSWVRALVDGEEPPTESGIVWFDPTADRLTERRSRDHPGGRPRATIGR